MGPSSVNSGKGCSTPHASWLPAASQYLQARKKSIADSKSLPVALSARYDAKMDEYPGQIETRRIEGCTRGTPIQLTTNEWYKAQQLAETYWLCVVWDPLEPDAELVRIQYPAVKLDHAKREIVASRFFEIPAEAINQHGG